MNVSIIQEMLASAARTAATYYSSGIEVGSCHALSFFVNLSAITAGTLDVTIQTNHDNGSNWVDVNSFNQFTAAKYDSEHMADETFGKYIRMKFVVAGGTSTFQAWMEKKESH
jgi:hypothetical protein